MITGTNLIIETDYFPITTFYSLCKGEDLFPSNTMHTAVLTDLLTELNQLHLCRHVAHCPHALAQIFTADKAIFIPVKLLEGFL